MKSPLCGVCLKSGMLCRTCRERVEAGLISDTDLKVSRILLELSGRVKSLKDVTLKKAVESDDLLVIICEEGEAAKFIGRSGIVAKKLERELGKRVSIVEEAGDVKEFIEKALHPVPVAGVNVLYREGKEALKVMVRKSHLRRVNARDLRETVKMLYGKNVEIAGA